MYITIGSIFHGKKDSVWLLMKATLSRVTFRFPHFPKAILSHVSCVWNAINVFLLFIFYSSIFFFRSLSHSIIKAFFIFFLYTDSVWFSFGNALSWWLWFDMKAMSSSASDFSTRMTNRSTSNHFFSCLKGFLCFVPLFFKFYFSFISH